MQPNFEPHTSPTPPPEPVKPTTPPPVPNALRQDHSMPYGEQMTVDVNNLPKNAGNNLFQPSTPAGTPTDYDFILNPAPPAKTKMSFNLPQSPLSKVVIGFASIVVVIILFAVISSLFKGSSNLSYFTSVLQDQQELTHLATIASSQADISSSNQNFVSTAGLVLSSNSSTLQSYLATNGVKVSSSVLSLKISSSTDTALTNAESAGNFNSTFEQVIKSQLNSYRQDLSLAYSKTSGPHGRAILSSLYTQAGLLLVSLSNGS